MSSVQTERTPSAHSTVERVIGLAERSPTSISSPSVQISSLVEASLDVHSD
jgi:hypothetical protein